MSGNLKSYDLYTKFAPWQKNEITLTQIQELTQLDHTSIQTLKNKADTWIKSIKEPIDIHITREIHDQFLEDSEIKKLSALERDVLSQIIADKFYEKAEGAADAHYNLYIAFSPCKNVNEKWSTTENEITKYSQTDSIKVIKPESKTNVKALIDALKEQRKQQKANATTGNLSELQQLPEGLITELEGTQFFKDNNRSLSAKIKFPNDKTIDLKICHKEKLRDNINTLWNAYRENFGEDKALDLFLHFCKNNVTQGLIAPVTVKIPEIENNFHILQTLSTRMYQDITIENTGKLNITTTIRGFTKSVSTNPPNTTAYKTDIDVQFVTYHPINGNGSYDLTKTKGQINIYNENLKPEPKVIQ